MSDPIFGREFYEKWFVPQPMTDAEKAKFERTRTQKNAYEREVLITKNSAWIIYNEFYPGSFKNIKPSSLTDDQILLAQSLIVELVNGRRAFQIVSAFAQSVLFKAPASLSGLGMIVFNFARKLPSDAFTGGTPSQATIASIQGDSDLKSYVAKTRLAEVCVAFDFKNGMTTAGGNFFF